MMQHLLGIWGGTFDPVHFGHLYPALELKQCLGLDEVRMVPCAEPVHRDVPQASAADRLEMLRCAVAGFSGLAVDDVEIRRGGRSFAVDTLLVLKEALPQSGFCLMMGCDAFQFFTRWHRWELILSLCHVVVVQRPGWSLKVDTEEYRLLEAYRLDAESLRLQPAGGILSVTVQEFPVSATELRRRVAAGLSIRDLTPDAVVEWIAQHGLYRAAG